jgi:hypothetical protein
VTTSPHAAPAVPDAAGSPLAKDDLASIFVIPEPIWTTISKRVGLVYVLEPIAPEVAKTIPEFPALVAACGQWRVATFWSLVTQSAALGRYCDANVQEFTRLEAAIAGLQPGDPLPPPVHDEAVAALRALDESTVTCRDALAPVTSQVQSLRDANLVADAEISAYVGRFGPEWVSLTLSLDEVDAAIGLVFGAWEAISFDVGRLASGAIPITTTLLLDLGIQSALLSWQHLAREVADFPSMAQGQERYLDGSWLATQA